MIRSTAILGLCCVLAFILSGCEEDEETRNTVFSGTLILVGDESPLPDLEVTLFEPESQNAVARDVSDSMGRFAFHQIPPGSYIPVIHANGYRPVFLPAARWLIEPGDQIDVELRLRRAAAIDVSGLTLTGRVIDTETKEPIANARIEMNFGAGGEVSQVNWSEYTGWSTTLEATSDEDGAFFLSPLPIFFNASTGGSFIPEYRVVAPGYRARVMDRNEDPKTLAASLVTVRLSKGEDLGIIEGLVLGPDGNVLEGVPVSAEWRQANPFFRGLEEVDEFAGPQNVLLPEGVSWTNARGEFRLTGLPQGTYNLLAGAYPTDGWVGLMLRGIQIERFDGVADAVLQAFPAVRTLEPVDGAIFKAFPDRLAWVATEGAVRYDLKLSRGSDGKSTFLSLEEPFLEINPGANFFTDGGIFAWEVIARDDQNEGLSQTDRPQVFHILFPED